MQKQSQALFSSIQWQNQSQRAQTETQELQADHHLMWRWLRLGRGCAGRLRDFHIRRPSGHSMVQHALRGPAWGGRLDKMNSRGPFEHQPFCGSVILWTRTLLLWSKIVRGRVALSSAKTNYFTQWWGCWQSYISCWLYWGSPRSSGKLRLRCPAS